MTTNRNQSKQLTAISTDQRSQANSNNPLEDQLTNHVTRTIQINGNATMNGTETVLSNNIIIKDKNTPYHILPLLQ